MSDNDAVCLGCALFVEPDDDGYPCPVADGYNGLIDEVLLPLGVVTTLTVTDCPLRLQLDKTLLGDGQGAPPPGDTRHRHPPPPAPVNDTGEAGEGGGNGSSGGAQGD